MVASAAPPQVQVQKSLSGGRGQVLAALHPDLDWPFCGGTGSSSAGTRGVLGAWRGDRHTRSALGP